LGRIVVAEDAHLTGIFFSVLVGDDFFAGASTSYAEEAILATLVRKSALLRHTMNSPDKNPNTRPLKPVARKPHRPMHPVV